MEVLICRTCLNSSSPENFVKLEEPDDDLNSVNILQMLNFCVPELDMYVVLNPVICKPCVESVKLAFQFKSQCIKTEEKVTSYLYLNMISQQENQTETVTKIDLKSVVQQNNNMYIKEEEPDEELSIIDPPSPVSFECINCKGCLASSVDPVDHVRVPTSSYQCYNCDKTLVRVEDFRKHVDSHVKRHLCNLCGKRFRNPSNLEVHMRSHTGDKPFECRYCKKKFQQRHTWLHHEMNHDEGTSLRCQQCHKLCSTKYNLEVHVKHYCKAKMLECFCEICGNGYTNKHSLKRHMLMQHPKNKRESDEII